MAADRSAPLPSVRRDGDRIVLTMTPPGALAIAESLSRSAPEESDQLRDVVRMLAAAAALRSAPSAGESRLSRGAFLRGAWIAKTSSHATSPDALVVDDVPTSPAEDAPATSPAATETVSTLQDSAAAVARSVSLAAGRVVVPSPPPTLAPAVGQSAAAAAAAARATAGDAVAAALQALSVAVKFEQELSAAVDVRSAVDMTAGSPATREALAAQVGELAQGR